MKLRGNGGHSAATSLPCLASLGHLTANKRLHYASPKCLRQLLFVADQRSARVVTPIRVSTFAER